MKGTWQNQNTCFFLCHIPWQNVLLQVFPCTLCSVCGTVLQMQPNCGAVCYGAKGCLFPCIINYPQCMTVVVGCPVKRPRDVSYVPKHHGMWHTVCWTIKHVFPFMHTELFCARILNAVSFVRLQTFTGRFCS